MSHGPLRVAVLDNQRIFADALMTRLVLEPDIDVVGIAHSAEGLWSLTASGRVDVVLLDVDLPEEDGLAVAAETRRRHPGLHLVVLTARENDHRAPDAVRLGVSGWVPKDGSVQELLHALRGAPGGGTFMPADLLTAVLHELTANQDQAATARGVLAALTTRESQVLQCMVDGLTRQETAERLHVTANTVRTHVQNILSKLGVHSSLTAVSIARRAGMAASPHR